MRIICYIFCDESSEVSRSSQGAEILTAVAFPLELTPIKISALYLDCLGFIRAFTFLMSVFEIVKKDPFYHFFEVSEKYEKIIESHEHHWFSTAKFKHSDEFVSHKLLRFVYFFAYRYIGATGLIFLVRLPLTNIYNRMDCFFDEI